MHSNKSISEFLKELGSKNSLPGGGSAAALTGAVTALFFASTFWRKLQNPKNAKLWIVYIGGYTPKPL